MNKIIQAISYLTIIFALGAVVLFIFWGLYPYNPIEFNQPHKIITKEVARGEHLIYEVDYCKNMTILPTITKTFVDGIIYAIPEIVAVDREVGCGVQQVSMYVPKALPTGEFYIKIIYHYQVNPIRKIDVITNTEKFTITK